MLIMPGDTINMIVLDRHTSPFFAPEFHAGAVETTLRFNGRMFEARLARDIRGETRVVMQAENNSALGTFVAEIDRFYLRKIEAVGTLEDYARAHNHKIPLDPARMCFFARVPCMIILKSRDYWRGNGGIIDLRRDTTREIKFGFDRDNLPARLATHKRTDFFSWSADENEVIIRKLVYSQSALRRTLDFFCKDDEAKSLQVFGCSMKELRKAQTVLRAALVVEARQGDYREIESVRWIYWLDSNSSIDANPRPRIWYTEPENLLQLKKRVRVAFGIKARAWSKPSQTYNESTSFIQKSALQRAINEWLTPTIIEVCAPTAHELLEAKLQIAEFEREYPL